jgi:hypothetical protein
MHLCLMLLFLVLLIPGAALGAESIKSVEVTNLPEPVEVQDVFVTNPPATLPAPASRFQFVGFTTVTYFGNLGGLLRCCEKMPIGLP